MNEWIEDQSDGAHWVLYLTAKGWEQATVGWICLKKAYVNARRFLNRWLFELGRHLKRFFFFRPTKVLHQWGAAVGSRQCYQYDQFNILLVRKSWGCMFDTHSVHTTLPLTLMRMPDASTVSLLFHMVRYDMSDAVRYAAWCSLCFAITPLTPVVHIITPVACCGYNIVPFALYMAKPILRSIGSEFDLA